MKFVLAYAGVPLEVFDQVNRSLGSIARQDCEVTICKPLKQAAYDRDHVQFFLKKFHELILLDHHNRLGDVGFAVVCVAHPNVQLLIDSFFPSTYVQLVDWRLQGGRKSEVAQSGNDLIRRLTDATALAKSGLKALRKEVTERANKTPLLLPVKNFKSKNLRSEMLTLQQSLMVGNDANAAVAAYVRQMAGHHPPKADEVSKLRYFLDARQIQFRAPGNAMHAFARPQQGGHMEECLLSGRRRLGAPYAPAFHYDCTKGSKKLKDAFFDCHGPDEASLEGNPHLNIAPNDFVRL